MRDDTRVISFGERSEKQTPKFDRWTEKRASKNRPASAGIGFEMVTVDTEVGSERRACIFCGLTFEVTGPRRRAA